jgi:hypothetical protein
MLMFWPAAWDRPKKGGRVKHINRILQQQYRYKETIKKKPAQIRIHSNRTHNITKINDNIN